MFERRFAALAIVAALSLTACTTTPTQTAATPPPGGYADGVIKLKHEHGPALIGKWEGPYTFDSGFRGRTTLTIVSAAGGNVQAALEWNWQNGGYGRSPDTGTMRATIGNDGKLHVGGGAFTLIKDGNEYTLEGHLNLQPGRAKHKWSRSGVDLSAVPATTTTQTTASLAPWPPYQAELLPHRSKSPNAAALPGDVKIVTPTAAVPAELAAFSGRWDGWMCRDWACSTKLAVEELHAKGGTIVYAFANEMRGNYHERMPAVFQNGELTAQSVRNFTVAYSVRPDGNLDAIYFGGGGEWASGVLTRE